MDTTPVQRHFDAEAGRYDRWKGRNWYYYQTIKELYREQIPRDASVLDVGCGTGDVLASLQPKRGVGIDISLSMIERAQQKHPSLEWRALTVDAFARTTQETFDVIFLSDVIEHLEDVERTFRAIGSLCHRQTRLLINMANPRWEPLLLALEKLHLKMPEGPHNRISGNEMNRLLEHAGFRSVRRKNVLLVPTYVPLLSQLVRQLERLPLLNTLCLIQLYEYRPVSKSIGL